MLDDGIYDTATGGHILRVGGAGTNSAWGRSSCSKCARQRGRSLEVTSKSARTQALESATQTNGVIQCSY